MDPRFQTSFIPKKPIVANTGRSSAPINLFSLLSTIIFIAALALSGGVFFYKNLVTKEIAQNKATLERAKGAFDPELIQKIIRLDNRIETSKQLLSSHLAVTPIFDFISSITLKTVRFKDFNFAYLAPDKIQVSMRGQAQSYSSVALQSDVLSSQKLLKNTIVSDMALEAAGTVGFNVSTIIDPSLLSYQTTVSRGQSIQSAPSSTQP